MARSPLGGLDHQPRGFGVVLFVLALLPASWIAYAVLSDLFFVGGTRHLGSDPIKEAEHLFGNWTLRMLVLTLTVTPLRGITGWNWLARHRRTLGLFTFSYAVLHVLTWALLDMQVVIDDLVGWDEIWTDIVKRPFITIGMAAFLLLSALAVTSTKKMMARLGKRWKQLHKAIYVIAALGVVHFWMAVKLDVREPLVFALIFAALLGWRWRESRRRAAVAATPPPPTPAAR
ncbi:MAG: protein-methionine-sulfoxide reductase heme-binding subunit MsrQ [Gemmatimonadaceae bacterium]